MLDNLASIEQWGPRIKARSVDATDMPFMNKTNMSDKERRYLGLWFAQQSEQN